MDLPTGYTWRRATFDDVLDVLELGRAVDVEEYGEPDWDESDVRDDWTRPRFDLDRDTWLVHAADGTLVAYAAAWDKEPHAVVVSDTVVRPDAPDLYPALVRAVSEHAAAHAAISGRAVARMFSSAPNARRAAALTDAGYAICRVFRRMVASLDPPPPAPAPKPGVTVRQVTPDDLPTVYDLNMESFADHFGFAPITYDEWLGYTVRSDSYCPEYWWLAETDGKPVAFLVGQRHGDERGWVRTVGTLTSARGGGAATALLLTAFAAFRADGLPEVALGVDSDNSTGAMALYERVGMHAAQRYDCYEREFTSS